MVDIRNVKKLSVGFIKRFLRMLFKFCSVSLIEKATMYIILSVWSWTFYYFS